MSDNDQRRTLVLTGASRGIGHATVQRFSSEGWRIITCSREGIPAHCLADPNWTHHIPTDLFNADDVERFVKPKQSLETNPFTRWSTTRRFPRNRPSRNVLAV